MSAGSFQRWADVDPPEVVEVMVRATTGQEHLHQRALVVPVGTYWLEPESVGPGELVEPIRMATKRGKKLATVVLVGQADREPVALSGSGGCDPSGSREP